MKKVYKFHWDCGRQGDVRGVFIAESDKVDALIESGKTIYFGEILGKHSEIYGSLSKSDLKVLTENPEEVALVERLELSSGYNPLDYISEDEE